MELGKVYTDCLTIPARMRELDQGKVDDLAKSMSKIGLQQPISVWSPDENTAILVAGHHRFAAALKLGWDEIDCIFLNMNETERRLWEISENLHRSELTVQERSDHIAEWVRLTESNISAQVGPKLQAGRPPSGMNAASRELGLERKEVQRAVKIAGIAEEAKEAACRAGLNDNQTALLEIAKAPEDQQVAKVEDLRRRRDAGPIASRVSVPRDPVKAAEALCKVFTVDELAKLIAVLMKSRQSDAA